MKQTTMSDVYAIGILFKKMIHLGHFGASTDDARVHAIELCTSANATDRFTAKQLNGTLQHTFSMFTPV